MVAVGPAVRPCGSVDEIVLAVKQYAAEHPDEDWIVGASYDGSLAPDGLFDARWLDAAVPDRPVMVRAWDYHTVWCNTVALELAGITAETPEPVRFAEQRALVDEVASPLLTAQTVKFFADGVVENETGALLAPYCSGLHSHSGGAERSESGDTWGCAIGRAIRWPRRRAGSTSSGCRFTSTPSATRR